MLSIALTGNIATGKTTVLKIFKKLGAETIDSDEIVAGLYKTSSAKSFLKKNFGTLNKKEIAEQVFSNPKKRLLLEGFFHPLVFSKIDSKISSLEKKRKKLVVAEVPLLFEANARKRFDKVIVVKATQPQQVHRLHKQGFSAAEAFARIKAQMPLGQKIKNSDFIIDNSSSLEETKNQVKKIFKQLKKRLK